MMAHVKARASSLSCVLLVTRSDEFGEPDAWLGQPGFFTSQTFHELAGRPVATAASMLTGVCARVHGVADDGSDLGYAGPTLAELLRAGGYRTMAGLDDPSLSRARGFARGFDDFLDAGGDDEDRKPITVFDRWLESRRADAMPFFAMLWWTGAPGSASPAGDRSDDGGGVLAEVVSCLERRAVLESTLVVAVGAKGGAGDLAGRGSGLVPVPLVARLPEPQPGRQPAPGPSGPADILPTILAQLQVELPAGLSIQGRSLVNSGPHRRADGRAMLIDQICDHALDLVCIVARDSTWAYRRLEARYGGRWTLTWRRILALLSRPAMRGPLLAVMRSGSFESMRRVDGLEGDAAERVLLMRSFAGEVELWKAECLAVRRAAARWHGRGDDQALRHRLRGLGYLG